MSKLIPVRECADDTTPEMVLVFVHGLGGDCRSTWCHAGKEVEPDSGEFGWMRWLADDLSSDGVPCNAYTFDYPASPSNWRGHSMPLYDRAGNFLEWLCGTGDVPDDVPITFVCHSLGGLLVKEMLKVAWRSEDATKRKLLDRVASVVFMGTPHNGSATARTINNFLGTLGRTTVTMAELEENAPALRELRESFIALVEDYDWDVFQYIEGLDYLKTRIVNESSAHSGVGGSVVIDAHHLSLPKVKDRNSLVFKGIKERVKTWVGEQQEMNNK